MSERDDQPAAENTREGQQQHLRDGQVDGASPGAVGALDGPAGAASLGAVSDGGADSEIPVSAPDPTVGPD